MGTISKINTALTVRIASKSIEKGALKTSFVSKQWKTTLFVAKQNRSAKTSSSRQKFAVLSVETKDEEAEVSSKKPEFPVSDDPPSSLLKEDKKEDKKENKKDSLSLDDVNPFNLGKKSRVFLDDVWTRVNQLGGIMRGSSGASNVDQMSLDLDIERALSRGDLCELQTPVAKYTTVLVVGATGRVGRVLVRKLLLRGYTVRALVRPRELREAGEFDSQAVPGAVEVIEGDVGDPEAAARAVKGCNKIVYCAGARSVATADLFRVDQTGVYNLTKAFQDCRNMSAQKRAGVSFKSKRTLFKFKGEEEVKDWTTKTSVAGVSQAAARMASLGLGARDRANVEVFEETGKGCVFTASLVSRNATAVMTTPLSSAIKKDLSRYDGFVLRICSDGKPYSVQVREAGEDGAEGRVYTSRFNTRSGWQTIRVPFCDFIPQVPGDPPLDVRRVTSFGLAYTARQVSRTAQATLQSEADNNKSRLQVHFIKLIPRGEEPDFLLVSCTGKRDQALRETDTAKLLEAKEKGEQALRNSGLGYMVVRPGALVEEPGGSKALVFDQGGRINQSISCADVADVLLRGLHDTSARNKSFEVCFEYIPEEGSLYELIAHLPDKSNNYLTAAMSQLDANT